MTYTVTVGIGTEIEFVVDADSEDEAVVTAMEEFEDCDLNDISNLNYVNVLSIAETGGSL